MENLNALDLTTPDEAAALSAAFVALVTDTPVFDQPTDADIIEDAADLAAARDALAEGGDLVPLAEVLAALPLDDDDEPAVLGAGIAACNCPPWEGIHAIDCPVTLALQPPVPVEQPLDLCPACFTERRDGFCEPCQQPPRPLTGTIHNLF